MAKYESAQTEKNWLMQDNNYKSYIKMAKKNKTQATTRDTHVHTNFYFILTSSF